MNDFLSQDPFGLFDLPVSFDVDLDELERRYHRLQRIVHPDRHAGGSENERRLAMQMTAKLNEAYDTLCSPLARTRCLLERHGRVLEANPSDLPPELLCEQIELREELEGLNDVGDRAGLETLRARLHERIEAIEDRLNRIFMTSVDEHGLDEATMLCYEMQFLGRLLEGLGDPAWVTGRDKTHGDEGA